MIWARLNHIAMVTHADHFAASTMKRNDVKEKPFTSVETYEAQTSPCDVTQLQQGGHEERGEEKRRRHLRTTAAKCVEKWHAGQHNHDRREHGK